MVDRISASDSGYEAGDLSLFPAALDDKNTLFEVRNNAETKLKLTLSYNAKEVVVEDASGFPDKGLIRVGYQGGQGELIYYDKKTGNSFQTLKRGFAGSRQNSWNPQDNVYVSNSVCADPHNALKDAVINMEKDLGLEEFPEETSLNGILKAQEVRFLSPKPIFRAFPLKGPASLKVRFQNYTTGDAVRYFWDFGDGGTSLERSPTHTYVAEGIYTVKLDVVVSTGGTGIVTKTNYIEVNNNESAPFFYVDSISSPYSVATAVERTEDGDATDAKEFLFIDQTDGDIVQRNWIFGDGNRYTEEDPDIHTTTHTYSEPGSYRVSLLIILSNGRTKITELPDLLTVL